MPKNNQTVNVVLCPSIRDSIASNLFVFLFLQYNTPNMIIITILNVAKPIEIIFKISISCLVLKISLIPSISYL